MTRTENEQELVLGNKQLLSAFFVVVALLGVFFTMGYIIGRNTNAPVEAKKTADAIPSTQSATPPVETSSSAAAVDPPTSTAPAIAPAKPVEEKKVEVPLVQADAGATAAVPVENSPGHMYLQVMAVKRPMADNTVKILKERGFPALLGESSKPELFRVLVGPYADTAALAKAKTDLKAMGFEPVVSK